jgi:hypothetical protein
MRFIIFIINYLKVIYIKYNKDLIIYIYANIRLFIKFKKFNSFKNIYLIFIL